jgi:DNA-binding NarL/FixJ family response regulator
MSVSIRLVLAEHPSIRQRLQTLVQEHEGWEVVAEASDGREAVRLVEVHKPDIAVVGLAMPLLNGIETTRRIVERSPRTRVIVLSTYSADVYANQTHRAGALGFVLTDSADLDLPVAIEQVSLGRTFTSPRPSWTTSAHTLSPLGGGAEN